MDLKERFKRIVVAYTYDGKPVTANDLKAAGSMALLMKDAIKPNLVQTLEGTPGLIHGGPFANIAHGANSIIATRMGMKLGDYMITEAGFGADLGAEKFFDIVCRYGEMKPDAVVVVASGKGFEEPRRSRPGTACSNPICRLWKQALPIWRNSWRTSWFGVPPVVALNQFPSDTAEETEYIIQRCGEMGVEVALSQVWTKGGGPAE